MKKSQNTSENSSSLNQNTTSHTYEEVVNALMEAGVCVFPKPANDDKFSNRQEHLQLLKTIQILAMKRKQFEEAENSKRAKVIEPLTVLTKGNKALLDEAQAKKIFLNKEIEINRQKLEALKQKKADQILQHEHELQEIKEKINELSHNQKVIIHCSMSQSNILSNSSSKIKEDISLKKKRKSDVIRNKSKTLLEEISEDDEIMTNEDKEKLEKPKNIEQIKPRNTNQNSLTKAHSRSARNSLSLGKVENPNKHRKSLNDSVKTLQTKSSTSENYEAVQKRMLSLFQAKQKSRRSSITLKANHSQNISLNDDEKSIKLSQTLTPSATNIQIETNDNDNGTPKPNLESIAKGNSETENNNNNTSKSTSDHPKTSRSRIPKRPRINYTQC